ncbi:MAG: alpha/beta hydrolase [Deltaproteobacteria bacterium]|nr:MAG: alpha/beta hydrolase [Deltaproteobacteria bacterium]
MKDAEREIIMEIKKNPFTESLKSLSTIFLLIALFLFGTPVNIIATDTQSQCPLSCQIYTIPVMLTPGEITSYDVVGTLCTMGSLENKTVQVLISGATYGHVYWDFPYRPWRYSYVRMAARFGYATFNIDRIGIGASDHPSGAEINVDVNAYVVHQIVQALRAGEIGGVAFQRVMLVGHSLGSYISIAVASQFQGDVDGVILTGFLHNVNPEFDDPTNYFYPANLDPHFSGLGLDDNYFTTVPGVRGDLFYYTPNTEQAVINMDEETKETATTGEFASLEDLVTSTDSLLIDVPVLIVIGRFDYIICGGDVDCSDRFSVINHEQPFFSPEACFRVSIVPNSGHDLNLHKNAPRAYIRMLFWANRHVGTVFNLPASCDCPQNQPGIFRSHISFRP